ncbi:MAG: MBL fold metallo-hydrolase [Chloroflexi bacterium]|nr:MBL fold metallo-hydrolase [Chloroflexota bacterium]
MITEMAPGFYWVGVVDWALRYFHGYELSTHRGSSYNSYLIVDEKIALVDAVWHPFQDDFLDNIRQVVDPARIDYIVVNHAEVDHSSTLPAVVSAAPNATLIVSRRGRESVEGHYHQSWNFKPVQTGDRISLGKREMVFIEAPMLHWPDTMFTYLTGDNILMSTDAFGQHYATGGRFNDEVDQGELYEEAIKYYANILAPYSGQVAKKIQEVLALDLPVSIIAPSHGVIWRKDPLQIVRRYQEWAAQTPQKSAVVLFDTMWQGTRLMAEAVGEGLAAEGVPYRLYHMAITDRNDVLTEIFKTKALLIGSPTLNNGILPTISPVLEDIRGLRFLNKIGAAFGTYGWSGDAVKIIEDHLARAKIPLVAEGVQVKWHPGSKDLERCRTLGATVGRIVKAG